MKPALLYALLGINLLTFLAFGWDKRAAIKGRSRVSEARLLTLALCFGAPGAWLATRVFRHKTVKTSFRVKLVLVTLLQVAAAVALLWWWGGEEDLPLS
jgi:uncharacterized membrane protein YsdA (DUF1294 family)